jgi:hypothetical protein
MAHWFNPFEALADEDKKSHGDPSVFSRETDPHMQRMLKSIRTLLIIVFCVVGLIVGLAVTFFGILGPSR